MDFKQFSFYCQTSNINMISDGLSNIPAQDKTDYIKNALQTSLRPDVVEYLGTEIMRLPEDKGTALLVELLYSEEAASRNLAIDLFQGFGKAGLEVLASHIHDMDPDVRMFVVLALQQLPYREAVLSLLRGQLVVEKDANVLVSLVEALGDLGGREEAMVIAATMKQYEHPYFEFVAKRALDRLGYDAMSERSMGRLDDWDAVHRTI